MKEEKQSPKHYTCYCSTCSKSRKEQKKLTKEDSEKKYNNIEILKEVLGQGNY